MKKEKFNKNQFKTSFKTIFISFTLILILFSFLIFYISFNVFFFKLSDDFFIEVYPGMTLKFFIEKLVNNGLSGNKNVYYFYARFLKPGFVLKKGKYNFKKGSNFYNIIEVVGKGVSELKKVTIPPGLKIKELIEYLNKNKIIPEKDFIKLISNKDFMKNWPIIEAYNSFEGFIFPETYFYSPDIKYEEVLKIFVDEFFRQLNKIININDYSFKEIYERIIVASLIEEEAFIESEKEIIASVIYNRLKKGMRLELCPTVEYILPKHKKFLTYEDLLIKSPYNTYINKGLPPTPICNPSLSSLKASFYPAQTEFLFYVSKGDGTHFFSKSFEEHLRYKRKSNYY
ncbi:MAG: endolytic transglycosylase MltG [Spirochaetes bacterium]|nr:endolytic transglycosylase MltG [Spirochaetota bacterium]